MTKLQDVRCGIRFGPLGKPTLVITASGQQAEYFSQISGVLPRLNTNKAEKSDACNSIYLSEYVRHFEEMIRPILLDSRDATQEQFDHILLDHQNDPLFPSAVSFSTSAAIAKCLSASDNTPLWSYLQNIGSSQQNKMVTRPILNTIELTTSLRNPTGSIPLLLIPNQKFSLFEMLSMGAKIQEKAQELLWETPYRTNNSLQGGILAEIPSLDVALNILLKASEQSGYTPSEDFTLGIDYEAHYYTTQKGLNYPWFNLPSSGEMHSEHVLSLIDRYPISYVEDPFESAASKEWSSLFEKTSRQNVLTVADHSIAPLTFTAASTPITSFDACVVKPDRLSTLTTTLNTVAKAQQSRLSTIISHRSFDNNDTMLTHIAVASGATFLKAGGMSSPDRVGKYNELMRIT